MGAASFWLVSRAASLQPATASKVWLLAWVGPMHAASSADGLWRVGGGMTYWLRCCGRRSLVASLSACVFFTIGVIGLLRRAAPADADTVRQVLSMQCTQQRRLAWGRRGAGGTDASLGLPSCLPLKTMTRDQTTTAAPVHHAGRDDAIRGAGRAGRRQLSRGFGAAGLEVERGPQLSLFECLDVLNLDAVLSQAFPPLTPSLPPVEKHRGVLEWGVKRARASARRPGA